MPLNLKDKITSYKDFIECQYTVVDGGGSERTHRISNLVTQYGSGDNARYGIGGFTFLRYTTNDNGNVVAEHVAETPAGAWWMAREAARVMAKVYPEDTRVIAALRGNRYCPAINHILHICPDDPTLVEFTIDPEQGVADRKVKMTLGRYLKKYMPMLPDHNIQQLEALHRAEMSDEVEWVEAERIAEAYLEAGKSGIGACMSHSQESYGGTGGLYPAEAYNMPGFRLAVLRSPKTQKLSARCLTWTNPADPEDKRMIRVYGDNMLERRLLRQGFKYKSLAGAMLKLMPVPGHEQSRVCAPYVDAPKGAQQYVDGRIAVRRKDHLILLSEKQVGEYRSALPAELHSRLVTLSASTGVYNLAEMPEDAFEYTCAVTGEKVDTLKDRGELYLASIDSTPARASSAAVPQLRSAAHITPERTYSQVRLHADIPVFGDPDGGSVSFVDTPYARETCGYHRLDPALYPDLDGQWVHSGRNGDYVSSYAQDFVTTDEGWTAGDAYTIMACDSVKWVSPDNRVREMHKDRLPASFTRVADLNGHKLWAAPGCDIALTDSRRRVIPGVHAVTRTVDGQLMYDRNVESLRLFGVRVSVARGDRMPRVAPDGDFAVQVRSSVQYSHRRWAPDLTSTDVVHEAAVSWVADRLENQELSPVVHAETAQVRLAGLYSQSSGVRDQVTQALARAGTTAEQIVEQWPAIPTSTASWAANFYALIKLQYDIAVEVLTELAQQHREKVERLKAVTAALPQIGDRVRITSVSEQMHSYITGEECNWANVWADEMDRWIGMEGTVTGISGNAGVRVDVPGTASAGYRFPTGSLVVIREAPAPAPAPAADSVAA